MPRKPMRIWFLGVLITVSASSWADSILLPPGKFLMGSKSGKSDEQPVHQVLVDSFRLDKSPVSVERFSQWIESSRYVTEADRFGNSAVFDIKVGRWDLVPGANWRKPFGGQGPDAPLDHPVTQVSWNDAKAYCTAQNGRLPTEAEFEYAAKGAGQYGDPVYSFGDKIAKDGDFLVNIYNGEFPFRNTGEDGYLHTAPLGETGITPLGFTDMAGNVWEWTASWYGPYQGQSPKQAKALRGGSFLCDEDVCHGYRTTGRTQSTPDSSLIHTGFRCAYDLTEET